MVEYSFTLCESLPLLAGYKEADWPVAGQVEVRQGCADKQRARRTGEGLRISRRCGEEMNLLY